MDLRYPDFSASKLSLLKKMKVLESASQILWRSILIFVLIVPKLFAFNFYCGHCGAENINSIEEKSEESCNHIFKGEDGRPSNVSCVGIVEKIKYRCASCPYYWSKSTCSKGYNHDMIVKSES